MQRPNIRRHTHNAIPVLVFRVPHPKGALTGTLLLNLHRPHAVRHQSVCPSICLSVIYDRGVSQQSYEVTYLNSQHEPYANHKM